MDTDDPMQGVAGSAEESTPAAAAATDTRRTNGRRRRDIAATGWASLATADTPETAIAASAAAAQLDDPTRELWEAGDRAWGTRHDGLFGGASGSVAAAAAADEDWPQSQASPRDARAAAYGAALVAGGTSSSARTRPFEGFLPPDTGYHDFREWQAAQEARRASAAAAAAAPAAAGAAPAATVAAPAAAPGATAAAARARIMEDFLLELNDGSFMRPAEGGAGGGGSGSRSGSRRRRREARGEGETERRQRPSNPARHERGSSVAAQDGDWADRQMEVVEADEAAWSRGRRRGSISGGRRLPSLQSLVAPRPAAERDLNGGRPALAAPQDDDVVVVLDADTHDADAMREMERQEAEAARVRRRAEREARARLQSEAYQLQLLQRSQRANQPSRLNQPPLERAERELVARHGVAEVRRAAARPRAAPGGAPGAPVAPQVRPPAAAAAAGAPAAPQPLLHPGLALHRWMAELAARAQPAPIDPAIRAEIAELRRVDAERETAQPPPPRFTRDCPICYASAPLARVAFTGCGHICCLPCARENALVNPPPKCFMCRGPGTYVKLLEPEEEDEAAAAKGRGG